MLWFDFIWSSHVRLFGAGISGISSPNSRHTILALSANSLCIFARVRSPTKIFLALIWNNKVKFYNSII